MNIKPIFCSVSRVGMVCTVLFGLIAGSLCVCAQEISIPEGVTALPQATIGEGMGTLTGSKDRIDLEGTPTAFAKYASNMMEEGTVFDFKLAKPVALPAGADKLSLAYDFRSSEKGNNDLQISFRPLIAGSNGAVWAVAMRFLQGTTLAPTRSPIRLETYRFSTSEIGRRDPWVMTSLDSKKFDEYSPLEPPYTLVGFRVMASGKPDRTFSLQVRDIRALSSGGAPSPYWTFLPERIWCARLGLGEPSYGNYGWGPENAVPYLKLSDVALDPGAYRYSWEILDLNELSVVAGDMGEKTVTEPGGTLVTLPLLSPGTYHLRLAVRRVEEKEFREYFLTYVVIRGSAEKKNSEPAPLHKSITVEGLQRFAQDSNQAAILTLRSSKEVENGEGCRLVWSVTSSSGKELKSGQSEVGTPVSVDLKELAAQQGESTLWLTARLSAKGKDWDIVRRIIGLPQPEPALGTVQTKPGAKLDLLKGRFSRTKADWSEGAMNVATNPGEMEAQLGPWFDEAVKVGYNTVEMSASWNELNPLPGVYQFQYLDRLVAMARDKKLLVVLRVHAAPGLVPLWIPREFQQNQEGLAHGLWGGSNVLVYSASSSRFREGWKRYLHALAAHYRDNATVLGYTLSSLYFDHDWLDGAWNAQYVDYSETAQDGFQNFVRSRNGGDLAAANVAYGKIYKDWKEIHPPVPGMLFDADGRLKPRNDALWQDWIDYKAATIEDFRMGGIEELRQGDPGCWIGLYASDSTPLYLKKLEKFAGWLACGSMESQFPLQNVELRGRYEPIGKVARTSELVDVGLSNLFLGNAPGYHGFSQYWMLHWRLENIEPAARRAEDRLRQWFAVVDRLMNAEGVESFEAAPKNGAYLISFGTQLNVLQHLFFPRFDDYLKPYMFRLGTDKVQVNSVHCNSGETPSLDVYPYIYVPYSNLTLGKGCIHSLVDYVNQGGRLVMESTGGYWEEKTNRPNALAEAFGLPEAVPTVSSLGTSEKASWSSDAPLREIPLAFRTQEFKPPINGQLTPWIHNIPRALLRPYRWMGEIPKNAKVIAHYEDGSPAALLLKLGKGEVLYFCGTIDWLGAPGLNAGLDSWGRGLFSSSGPKGDPALLSRTLRKDETFFVVGRRFINQNGISDLIDGKLNASLMVPQALPVVFSMGNPTASRYHVSELIDGRDLGSFSVGTLIRDGISLPLTPGQAFLLEAVPMDEKGSATAKPIK